jgi:polyphosphate kinase
MFPVEDKRLINRLRHEVLRTYLADTVNAHLLRPDGTYERVSGKLFDSQAWLLEYTVANNEVGPTSQSKV